MTAKCYLRLIHVHLWRTYLLSLFHELHHVGLGCVEVPHAWDVRECRRKVRGGFAARRHSDLCLHRIRFLLLGLLCLGGGLWLPKVLGGQLHCFRVIVRSSQVPPLLRAEVLAQHCRSLRALRTAGRGLVEALVQSLGLGRL